MYITVQNEIKENVPSVPVFLVMSWSAIIKEWLGRLRTLLSWIPLRQTIFRICFVVSRTVPPETAVICRSQSSSDRCRYLLINNISVTVISVPSHHFFLSLIPFHCEGTSYKKQLFTFLPLHFRQNCSFCHYIYQGCIYRNIVSRNAWEEILFLGSWVFIYCILLSKKAEIYRDLQRSTKTSQDPQRSTKISVNDVQKWKIYL